jgi:hypothetical protein
VVIDGRRVGDTALPWHRGVGCRAVVAVMSIAWGVCTIVLDGAALDMGVYDRAQRVA